MIEVMPESTGNLLVLKVSGEFDLDKYLPSLYHPLALAAKYGTYRIVLYFEKNIVGMNVHQAIEMSNFLLEQKGQLEKLALVGRPEWAGAFAEHLALAVGVDFADFGHDHLSEALAWAEK